MANEYLLRFESQGDDMYCTLAYPDNITGNMPAAILVHGSGPHDRDSTIGPNNPFKDISDYLTANGITVLRYDKRTFTYNHDDACLKKLTIKEEVIDDAVNAINFLSSQIFVDPDEIYLIGHSLGGWSAPLIAQETSSLKGICMMAGNARPVDEVIKDQTAFLLTQSGCPNHMIQSQIKPIEEYFERLRHGTVNDDEILPLFPGVYPNYWKSWINQDPTIEVRKFKNKILILQGENDFQVTMKDFNMWRYILGSASMNKYWTKSFPKLNHLFMRYDQVSTGKDYIIPGNVDREVLETIVEWIKN